MPLTEIARNLKRELATYQLLARHPETPRVARWLLALAVGYLLMPFDLIPDFLPVIGHLDDVVIIPLLVALALKQIPSDLKEKCRSEVMGQSPQTRQAS